MAFYVPVDLTMRLALVAICRRRLDAGGNLYPTVSKVVGRPGSSSHMWTRGWLCGEISGELNFPSDGIHRRRSQWLVQYIYIERKA
jgi:hypothetical protein